MILLECGHLDDGMTYSPGSEKYHCLVCSLQLRCPWRHKRSDVEAMLSALPFIAPYQEVSGAGA